jgi:tetratricopeptide (TPR) repeat protein
VDEGVPLMRTNLEAVRRSGGERDERYVVALHDLSNALLDALEPRLPEAQDDLPEVQGYLTRALELCRELFPADHYLTYAVEGNLVQVSSHLGRLEESEALCRERLAWSRAKLGDDHPETSLNVHDLSIVLSQRGAFEEARSLGEEALLRMDEHFGRRSLAAIKTRYTLSETLLDAGSAADAESVATEGLDLADAVLPRDHNIRLRLVLTLGMCALEQQQRCLGEALRALD